jgi:ATP-binding cassette, subfamily B, bacterial PglK
MTNLLGWYGIFRNLKQILPVSLHKKSVYLLFGLIFLSLLDFIGLAILAPLLLSFMQSNVSFVQLPDLLQKHTPVVLSIVLVFYLLKLWYAIYISRFQITVCSRFISFLSQNNLRKILSSNHDQKIEKGSSGIMEKVYFEPLHIGMGVFLPVFALIQESFVVVILTLALLWVDPLLSFGIFLLIGLSGLLILKKMKGRSSRVGETNAKNRKELFEKLNIGLSGLLEYPEGKEQEHLSNIVGEKILNMSKGELLGNFYKTIPFRVNELLSIFALVFMILYSLATKGNADNFLVMATLFALAVFRIIPAINRIQLNLVQLNIYQIMLQNFSLFDPKSNLEESIQLKRNIVLVDFGIRYNDDTLPILENININITKGTLNALIGKSGSGKSSLLKVLSGQKTNYIGSILIDGTMLGEDTINCWKSKVAYIGQNPYIVDGSLLENICFGSKQDLDLEKINQALHLAGLEEFKDDLENKKTGESGFKLSEGQKQRLMLARAIYADSELYLLDEITANLDTESTSKILLSLKKLKQMGKTICISTHNPKVAEICDTIYTFSEKNIQVVS